MISIKTIAEAEELLARYVPLTRQITGRDITLDRMRPLMEAIDNPQERLKIIHVAGTSGKTSTAYYVASLLCATGKKVGLTVSPHIDSVTERVQINMKPLDEATFTGMLAAFVDIIEAAHIQPTYFELLVAFAYWYFEKANLDYAVVETGMGGLHDGTNIASNKDKVCIITDIGLDHMHVLGNTVTEIARQKAGIIHLGNAVFAYEQEGQVTKVFEDWCKEQGAELRLQNQQSLEAETGLETLRMLPNFQQRNWLLAHKVFAYMQSRDGLMELSNESLSQSLFVQVPGRMDQAAIGNKTIVMDGAHNEQKMQAFVSSFVEQYPDRKVPILLSLKLGKEFTAVLPLLKPIVDKLIISTFEQGQDLPIPSIDPYELGEAAERFGFENVVIEPDQDKAFALLLQETSNLAIITGSFYLIGQLRHNHRELQV